ncbi:androgen-dependent TFPI-regulating protein-like [Argonauta hians]
MTNTRERKSRPELNTSAPPTTDNPLSSRSPSMSLCISCFHLIAFMVLGFGTYADTFVIQYGWNSHYGKFKYLTYWNIWIQTLYFVISLLRDLIMWRSVDESDGNKVRRLKITIDHIHATIVYPVGIFVVVTFWVIYHFDRELVFPLILDEIVPSWLNHILHTWPIIFLLLDKFLVQHDYPTKFRGICFTIFYTSIYVAWILFLALAKGIWVYPVLQILNNNQRFVFISVLWMFAISIYLVGDSLTFFLWKRKTTVNVPPVSHKTSTNTKKHKSKQT